ncbi:InlB B-repeat-containing protein [Butyrivibrio proteoclasticus]|uniref:InlB B-repeat-containing protein n=1 Tax=Butyrivibrio proteoclasticus TaxID=43305 RepID=UPI0018CC30F0|nr:InlB B-repeat-containing protein [Butyrivibrio proteoclasticus]
MKLTRKLVSLLMAGTMVIGSVQPANAAGYTTEKPIITFDDYDETHASSAASSDVSIIVDEEDDDASRGSAAASSASSYEEIIIIDDDEENEESSDAASSASSDESTEDASLASSDDSSDAASLASSDELEDEELPEDYYTVFPVGGVTEDEAAYDVESVSVGEKGGLLKAAYLPDTYTTPNLPRLRNQGKYGTCWAHAVNSLADISLIKNGYNSNADMSELHLAYFAYNSVADPLGGTEGDIVQLGSSRIDDGGNATTALRTYSRWIGAADETTVPYSKASQVYYSGLSDVLAYEDAAHVTSYYLEPVRESDGTYKGDYIGETLPNIKTLIKEYGAVYISFEAYDSMSASSDKSVYNVKTNAYYNPKKYSGTNHAVAVVGWDDNFSKDNFVTPAPGDGAFLVRNSWKDGKGNDTDYSYSGYFWMSYYEGTLGTTVYAAEFEPASSYDNNYQYDGGEGIQTVDSAKNAVVFKTHAVGGELGEELGAIAFYTATSNVNYTVQIYTNLTKENDPTSGGLVSAATTTGSTTFAGMHRVELKNAVQLEPNTTFAVVVTLQKSGEKPKIGLEYSFNGEISCEANHGFYWLNNRWNDISEFDGDLIIKAYTNNIESTGEGGDPTDIRFTGIENNSLELGVGETSKILTSVLPYDATDRTVTWSSSDESIVTVSEKGVVTGISKGTATLTVKTNAGNVTKTIDVTVVNKLLDIAINYNSEVMNGDTDTLEYVTSPENYSATGKARWSTSTPDTVKINSESGEVKFIKIGKGSVSVTLDGKTATADFNIYPGYDVDYGYTVTDDNVIELWWNGQDNAEQYILSKNQKSIYTVAHSAGTKKYTYSDDSHKDDFSSRYMEQYNIRYDFGSYTFGTSFLAYTHRVYQITYELNGGTQNPLNPSRYISGKGTPLYPASKEGYVFAGWYTSSSLAKNYKIDSITDMRSGNLTLYAKFVSEKREIKYVLNGGTQNPKNPTYYSVGETVQLYDPTPQKGYVFEGWLLGSNYSSNKRTVLTAEDTSADAEDIVLYARFTRVYTKTISMVRVVDNAGNTDSDIPETISVGDTLVLAGKTGPTGANPDFTWKNYGTSSSPAYVKCTPKDIATAEIDDNGYLNLTAVKSGTVEVTVISGEYSSVKDARTIKITNPNERSITYVLGDHVTGNSASNPATYVQGEETFLYDPYIASYYEFQGWYLDAAFSPDKKRTKILATDTGDLTLYAKVIGAEKNITYYLNGGTQNPNNPTKYRIGESAELYAPTPKKGYVFDGWYLDSAFSAEKKVTSLLPSYTATRTYGITLHAKYVKVEVTGISLGTVKNGVFSSDIPDVLDKGDTIVLQAQVQPYGKEGLNTEYTWKNYGSVYRTEYVKCTPSGIATAQIQDGNLVITATGKGTVEVTAVSADNKNVTVSTIFTLINSRERSISYVLGKHGAGNDKKNPTIYEQGTEAALLEPVAANGYEFEGWYLDSAFSPDKKRTKILATDAGDLTLYAKFIGAERKIRYVLNGGTQNAQNPTTYRVGESVELYPLEPKPGYAFEGWYIYRVEAQNKRAELRATDTEAYLDGITLHANFKKTEVTGIRIGQIVNDETAFPLPETLDVGQTIELQAQVLPYGALGLITDYKWKNYGNVIKPVYVKCDPAGIATAEIKDDILVITALGKGTIEVTATSDDNTSKKKVATFTILNSKEKRIRYSVGQNADFNPENPAYYEEGTTTQLYSAIPKRGYAFEGWFLDPEFSEDKKRTEILATDRGELTLYAKVSSTERTITYVPGIGTQNSQNPDKYIMGEEVKLYDAVAPVGYVFAGWYLDENYSESSKREVIKSTDRGNLTLYARYEKVNVTGITILKVDGKNTADYARTIEVNSSITLRGQVEPYGVKGLNTAYYWKNYGTESNPVYVKCSDTGIATADINASGDLLIAATGKGTVEVTAVPADDETKAETIEFKIINSNEHSITYVVGEHGTFNDVNPDSYENGEEIQLKAPATEKGYVFEGWFLDDKFSRNKKRDAILATDRTDLTFYAKISKVEITGISVSYIDEYGSKLTDIPSEMEIGDVITLSAQVEPYGKEGLNADYSWRNYGNADNPVYAKVVPENAASVSMGSQGNLIITAQSTGDSSEAYVEVTAIPEGDEAKARTVRIKIVDLELQIISADRNPKIYGSNKQKTEAQNIELATGKTAVLKTRFIPAVADKTVVWASSNPAIASVDAAGKITANSAGYAVITAVNGSESAVATTRVNVYDPVTSIVLDQKTIKLGTGQTAKLKAATMPSTASDEVYYVTSKPGVVEVDNEGNIRAIGAGTTVITARSIRNEKSATCSVTVGNTVDNIVINGKGSNSVAVGKTLQMLATFNDGDKSRQPVNKDVTWDITSAKNAEGNDDQVATINAKGLITATEAGVITVVARSTTDRENGSFVESEPATIFVYASMSKAALNNTAVSLYKGKSYKLKAVLTPAVSGETVTGLIRAENGNISFSDAGSEVVWALKNEADRQYLKLADNNDGTCTVTALDYADTRDKKVAVTATVKPYGAAKATVLTCNVTVSQNAAVTKISVNPTNLKINRGADADISAILTPMVPENTQVKWTIADADRDVIAFVGENGNVLSSGSVTTGEEVEGAVDNSIRIRALSNGNVAKTKATINVETVGTNAKGMTLNTKVTMTIGNEANTIVLTNGKTDVTWDADYNTSVMGKLVQVEKGKSVTLKAAAYQTYVPGNARLSVKAGNQAVTWTSSDTSVATINASGKITALKPGQTWITAVSKDINYGASGNIKVSSRALVYVYASATKASLDKSKATLGMEVSGRTSSYRQYDVVTMVTSDEVYDNPGTVNADGLNDIVVPGKNVVTWTVNAGAAGDEFIAVAAVPTADITMHKTGAAKQQVLGDLEGNYVAISKSNSFITSEGESLAIKALKPGTVTITATTPGGKKATCAVKIYTHVQDTRLKLTWKDSDDGNRETLGSYSNPVIKQVTVTEGKKKVNKSVAILEESDGVYDYIARLDTKNNKSLKLVPTLDYYMGEGNVAYYYDRKTTALEKSATATYNEAKKYAANSVVNYRSYNPTAVSVASNGTITVKKVGANQTASAVITISTADGSIKKRVLVKVRNTAADWVED